MLILEISGRRQTPAARSGALRSSSAAQPGVGAQNGLFLPSTSTVTLPPRADLTGRSPGQQDPAGIFGEIATAEKNISSIPESAESRFRIAFSVSKDCLDKLNQAKSILSRKYPRGANLENVLTELLEFYLTKKSAAPNQDVPRQTAPRQTATRQAAPQNAAPGKRIYLSRDLRRQVFAAAQNCCAFTAPDGTCCQSHHDLEIDHITPLAKGGSNSPQKTCASFAPRITASWHGAISGRIPTVNDDNFTPRPVAACGFGSYRVRL